MKKIGYIIIFTVCTLLCLSTSRTRADSPLLDINCPNTTTFTPNSPYRINLNTLLSSLHDNASFSPTGFFSSSVGTSDVVNGIFLCRGDVSTDDCSNCVQSATEVVLNWCPESKEATMWYSHCMIHYSNDEFLGNFYSGDYVSSWENFQSNVSDPEGRFGDVLSNTLRDTAARAAVGDGSGKKYAVGEGSFSESQTVYVLAQCTPDLWRDNCDNCLAICNAELSTLNRRVRTVIIGAGILYPSCNVRFQIYQFYNTRAVAPPPPSSSLSPPPPSSSLSPPPPSSSLSPPPPPPAKGKEKKTSKVLVAVVVGIGASVILFVLGFCLLTRRKSIRKKNDSVGLINQGGNDINTERSLQYDLSSIQAATNNFSLENKIGEGGYGSVYKGVLANGIEVAVKRLSQNSGQGATEFKNEVIVVEKLQHRNLVKLLGFCLQGEEKILIYEFVPNKSLDYFLFDPQKSRTLDWSRRFKIIAGIARGMLYLHEDSRLRIIHRDLKAANILLDGDMTAKVADFGMARIFGRDQTHGNTSRVVGTLGYMSPEYFLGHFSVKSDVFSFGVLILEIISGVRSNSNFHLSDCSNLEGYAWKLWEEGRPLDLIDDVLQGSYSESEVRRCIHIGLLCVQDDPDARPSMATVVTMLNSNSLVLPIPSKPAFFDLNQAVPTLPNMKDQSTSQPIPPSVNEASITDLYPR